MKIIVIGDACLDIYHYGEVRRLNPEAPVPIIVPHHTEVREGMAGNVNNNLLALGAETKLHVPVSACTKTRYIDKKSGYQLLRVDKDLEYSPYEVAGTYACDAIVVSDYNKGFITVDTIIELRRWFDGPIYVDSKKNYLPSLPNVYYKVNETERASMTNTPENLVVTLGANGCMYAGRTYPAPSIEVVDVCGAGDVFLASMAYFHTKHQDMDLALKAANHCAAASCRHVGCLTLTTQDLQLDFI
jgi:D-glycero-beta-D-manno-heptose-7-phosphate kinase